MEGGVPFETSHRKLGRPKITIFRNVAEAEKVNYLLPFPFQDFLNNPPIKPAQEAVSRKGRKYKCEPKGGKNSPKPREDLKG